MNELLRFWVIALSLLKGSASQGSVWLGHCSLVTNGQLGLFAIVKIRENAARALMGVLALRL